jgi:solute carrier family 25 phosphate transporter 3
MPAFDVNVLPAAKAFTVFSGAEGGIKMHSLDYYAKCMFGGVLACGLTHAATVSLDVHKCRSQAHAKSGAWPGSLPAGIKKILAEEGAAGMRVGWVPTFFGYGAQGLFKFGLNEVFKDVYSGILGEETLKSTPAKMAMWAAASGSAEIFADVALCPFEMAKVKMQVQLPGRAMEPIVPTNLMGAFSVMAAHKATTGFPFGSLVPLWGRQVPYTMIKFVGFYVTAEWVYEQLAKKGVKKADMSTTSQLAITFASGYWAGIFCAIATQPMDNLVSMRGAPENANKSFGDIARDAGAKTLFLKGLGTRVLMIGTLTGLQWYIYGTFKSVMGFGTQ